MHTSRPTLPLITQQLQQGHALEALAQDNHLFVNTYGPWVQLCYHSTRSPTDSPLVHECRGLVLRPDRDWRPVCWGLDRFFDHGEEPRTSSALRLIPPIRAEEKEDGTYILLFYDEGQWHAATRHTFCAVDTLYERILLQASDCPSLRALADRAALDPEVTWCLEVCSLENRILRRYETPTLFLLAAFRLADHLPLSDADLDAVAVRSAGALRRPRVHAADLAHIGDALVLLSDAVAREPLFEGLVLRDASGQRLKLKSPRYRELDRFTFQGWAQASPRALAPFLLQPDRGASLLHLLDGLLTPDALAEFAWRIERYGARIRTSQDNLAVLWAAVRALPRAEATARIRQDPEPNAAVLVRHWAALASSAPPSWEALLRTEGDRVLRPLFGADVASPLAMALEDHGPVRCPLPDDAAPGAGMARCPPARQADGSWAVRCACGAPMALRRLKVARVGYLECHCGGRVGLHPYPAATLLWLCDACGCTHEAHQETQSWPDEGIVYTRGQPLGIPADRACKALRLQVHEEMAALRGVQRWSRSESYQWLARTLALPRPRAHVALFDIPMCVQAIQACQTARPRPLSP